MYKTKTEYEKIIKKLKEKGEVFPGTKDSVFKSLIGDEELKDFTAFLISNCNGRILEEDNMVFINTEGTKKNIADKVNIHDVLIDVGNGRISLEANGEYSKELIFRNMAHFYEGASKVINVSYRSGRELYYEQINFDAFDNGDDLVSIYKWLNVKTGKEDLSEKNFVKYHINLALIYKKYYTYGEELTRFEKALAILSFNKIKDLRKIAKGDEMLMRVEKKIEDLCDNIDLVRYIDDEKAMEFGRKLDIEEAAKKAAEKAAKEAAKKASEETSKKEKIETAKKMLKDNLDIDTICKYTDLTKEEIENLKTDI